jgi:hypothetical protein
MPSWDNPMIFKHFAGASLAFVLACGLGACDIVHPEEKLPPQAAGPGIELTKQQDGRFIAFVGPKRQHTEAFLGVDDTNYFTLRSWYDNKTSEAAHQLYIEDSYYGGPFKWDGVHDAAGKALKFIPISRNQIDCDEGCAYADEFAAELPEDYLRAHKGGFELIFTSSDGKNLPVKVPSDFVTAQLNAVDSVRNLAQNTTKSPSVSAAPASEKPTAEAPPPLALAPTAATTPALPPGTIVPPPPVATTP